MRYSSITAIAVPKRSTTRIIMIGRAAGSVTCQNSLPLVGAVDPRGLGQLLGNGGQAGEKNIV